MSVLCKCRTRDEEWKYFFQAKELKLEGEKPSRHWEGRVRGIKNEIKLMRQVLNRDLKTQIDNLEKRETKKLDQVSMCDCS